MGSVRAMPSRVRTLRLGDRLAPPHLGTDFRWLWSSAAVGNLGDGLLLAAGPLLIASITTDPFAIALAVFLQRVPWVLFGLLAGVVVDRVDRRLLSAGVDAARAAVVAALTVAVATDAVSELVVYVAVFLLGINLEFLEITFIVVPIFVPAMLVLGFTEPEFIWFAVLMAINLNIAFISPPVGFSLFYLQGVKPPEVATSSIHLGALPFMGLQLLALVLVGIIVIKVVPTFADFYASFERELPLSTQAILLVSDTIRAQLWLILLIVAGAVMAFVSWIKRPGRGAEFDRLRLGREPGEHADDVGAVGLGGPDRFEAGPLGRAHDLHRVLAGRADSPISKVQSEL